MSVDRHEVEALRDEIAGILNSLPVELYSYNSEVKTKRACEIAVSLLSRLDKERELKRYKDRRSPWPKDVCEAVEALEERFGIVLCSGEHHAVIVDRLDEVAGAGLVEERRGSWRRND